MFTKRRFFVLSSILMLLAVAGGSSVIAATNHVWTQVDDTDLSRRPLSRTRTPDFYKTFALNKQNLDRILDAAPEEFTQSAVETILELPMPDGSFGKFRISHSLIVENGLLVKFPELGRTFSAQGVDDPTATARLDYLPTGFHAMILSPNGTVIIDPYAVGDVDNYVTYYKRDLPKLDAFNCEVGQKGFESIYNIDPMNAGGIPDESADVTSGGTLRTYRLALAATVEYSTAVGGNTIAGALAAEVLIMNRVNGVYERDLSMRMVIIGNNNLITYAGDQTCAGVACTTANDPYFNSDAVGMLSQNQTNIDSVIGTPNYDIGHVFSTGGGGVANLNTPCSSSKARGVTGLPNPIGDPFAIDYVAHEMGHQWGSNHTFNGASGNCSGGNRSSTNAFEPGSGITIMAYAGICGNQNLAANSIDTMHVRSLEVIVAYSQVNNGNTCSTQTATGNTPPTVPVVGGPFNIPRQTPFSLTASSTDVNGDSITYDWQEYDLGAPTTAVPNTDADGAMPIFRTYLPTVSGTRTFPSLPFILNNANVPPATTGGFLTGELLPQITRTMNFQVVARDNRSGGGGINTATAVVNVDGASGPFVVTSPNTNVNWAANSSQTVAWNVANTTAAPVSAANVRILFSSDGGLTFPTTILASTPNDGTETITVPNLNTTLGRIKIEGIGNIFFDISDVNFTIVAPPTAANASVSGRVLTANGNGIRGVFVTITGSNGDSRTVRTSSFGYYAFEEIPAGETYVISVRSKRYQFSQSSQVVTVTDNMADVNFMANN